MKTIELKTWLFAAALTYLCGVTQVSAAEPPVGMVGKNQWLFYRYELSDANDAPATDQSLDLIRRFNRVLASRGVTMAVAMVPLKMRIYAEHLPDDTKVNAYMDGNYERMSKLLRASGVNVLDLNSAFLKSPKRNSSEPLFYRLDTHWSQTGVLVAADAIKAGIGASPVLQKALAATPVTPYNLQVGKDKIASEPRDLVGQLPPGAQTFPAESVTPVIVRRDRPAKDGLFGDRSAVGVSLLGSSYSRDWTGFADALRYALQRDVLSIGVPADQGSWIGMESYLRDDAFQTRPPKLLIWEMPERDMRAPPDYKYRDARYISDNTEWLLRASAWAQAACKPALVQAKFSTAGLGASARNAKAGDLETGPTRDGDFVEVAFDRPLDRLDYLAVQTTVQGSKSLTLEGSGAGAVTRRFSLTVAGDDLPHAVKMPLPSSASGFTRVKIFPGNSSGFALQNLQVCRQPDDLLK
jgi:alginate O-acetyltransferase complex protein AlgJ